MQRGVERDLVGLMEELHSRVGGLEVALGSSLGVPQRYYRARREAENAKQDRADREALTQAIRRHTRFTTDEAAAGAVDSLLRVVRGPPGGNLVDHMVIGQSDINTNSQEFWNDVTRVLFGRTWRVYFNQRNSEYQIGPSRTDIRFLSVWKVTQLDLFTPRDIQWYMFKRGDALKDEDAPVFDMSHVMDGLIQALTRHTHLTSLGRGNYAKKMLRIGQNPRSPDLIRHEALDDYYFKTSSNEDEHRTDHRLAFWQEVARLFFGDSVMMDYTPGRRKFNMWHPDGGPEFTFVLKEVPHERLVYSAQFWYMFLRGDPLTDVHVPLIPAPPPYAPGDRHWEKG